MQVSISSMLIACFTAAQKRDYIGGFAGQISGLIHEIPTAREVLEDMVEEAVTILSELPKRVTFS
jgi:nitronate monooxygenase